MLTDGEKIRRLRGFFAGSFQATELELFLFDNERTGRVRPLWHPPDSRFRKDASRFDSRNEDS
jgi:hypothetical protein